MRFAYADPPYPGQAVRRYGGIEVDHSALIERLRTYDGWALSTSAAALREVWNLCPEARCAAWVKTLASNGWCRVRWTWEPVLFVTPRRGIAAGERSSVRDGLVSAPDVARPWQEVRGRGGGAKPYPFVRWVVELLGAGDGDTVDDLFPGSGNVARFAGLEQLELFPAAPA